MQNNSEHKEEASVEERGMDELLFEQCKMDDEGSQCSGNRKLTLREQ